MTTRTAPSPSSPIPTRSKEAFVHRLFDTITPAYDLFNRISSLGLDRGWRSRAIRSLQLLPGTKVLDLASGTGDLAMAAAQELAPLGEVIACDLSHPMLRFAQEKIFKVPAALWHIRQVQGRAESLPLQDRSFHAAAIGFALRNVSDLKGTFRELHRVLRPGGRLAILEFGRPNSLLLRIGHQVWLAFAIPLLGLLTTGRLWPFLYLRRSILRFMPPAQVMELLKASGFSHVKAEPLTGGALYLYTARRLS